MGAIPETNILGSGSDSTMIKEINHSQNIGVLILGLIAVIFSSRTAVAEEFLSETKTQDELKPSIPSYVKEFVEKACKPCEYNHTLKNGESRRIYYRLFTPAGNLASTTGKPLIVWLNGFSEGGKDNVSQLRHLELIFKSKEEAKKCDFFLLAVQCSPLGAWTNKRHLFAKEDNIDSIEATYHVINHLVDTKPIDQERISLAGVSTGGKACLIMAARYPKLFASISPISAGGTNHLQLSGISNVDARIWAFHNQRDYGIESIRKTVQSLQNLNVACKLTVFNKADHDSWTDAFSECNLLRWLLYESDAQRWMHEFRNTDITSNLWRKDRISKMIAALAVSVVLYACWREYRRQKKSQP